MEPSCSARVLYSLSETVSVARAEQGEALANAFYDALETVALLVSASEGVVGSLPWEVCSPTEEAYRWRMGGGLDFYQLIELIGKCGDRCCAIVHSVFGGVKKEVE